MAPLLPFRAHSSSFFWLFLLTLSILSSSLIFSLLLFSSLLFASLLFSSLTLPPLLFPPVHIVRSLTSKPPSIRDQISMLSILACCASALEVAMQQDFDDPDHFMHFGALEVDNQGGFTDEDLPELWMHPRHVQQPFILICLNHSLVNRVRWGSASCEPCLMGSVGESRRSRESNARNHIVFIVLQSHFVNSCLQCGERDALRKISQLPRSCSC